MNKLNKADRVTLLNSPIYRRYLRIRLAIALKKGNNFVYYNGGQGLEYAVLNNQFAKNREEAIRLLAIHEGVTEMDILNDHKNWYYIPPLEEEIDACRPVDRYGRTVYC